MTPTTILATDSHVLLSLEDYTTLYEASRTLDSIIKKKGVLIRNRFSHEYLVFESDEQTISYLKESLAETNKETDALRIAHDFANNRIVQLEVQLGIYKKK